MGAQIDKLFVEMAQRGASDLHLTVGSPPLFREKGAMVPMNIGAIGAETMRKLLHEIMRPDQITYTEENLDYDFAYEVPDVARFRANVFFDHRGMGAVFRIIPTEILSLEKLGCPPSIQRISEFEKGLVLVTGPTGSGKSTTLAAMINHINENRYAHLITLEDPIEFVHPPKKCLVTQREIHYHATSFARAIRAACREDPDILLVGEMRDYETISLALSAAELGILVFGTLHTNSAAKTIDRIVDVFPAEEQGKARSMLSDSLKGVVAQQLIRTADGKGRCAAHEIMVGNSALASLIRESKISQIASLIQTGSSEGMQTMDQSLMNLVKEKKITQDEAWRRAVDKSLFKSSA